MTTKYRGTKAELAAEIRRLAGIVTGKADGDRAIAAAILVRGGNALLSQVQQAFIEKSRGGTGSDGIKWSPLDPKTIAYGRRITRQEYRDSAISGRKYRGILTKDQDRRWRNIFGTRLATLLGQGVGEAEAKGIAARIAWATLKQEGVRTKLELFGGRQVDILRDTGELLRSFQPGVAENPSGADGQIFRVEPGEIVIGTNKKTQHHKGIPGKLPARPFWPDQVPKLWLDEVQGAIVRGIVLAATKYLANKGAA